MRWVGPSWNTTGAMERRVAGVPINPCIMAWLSGSFEDALNGLIYDSCNGKQSTVNPLKNTSVSSM